MKSRRNLSLKAGALGCLFIFALLVHAPRTLAHLNSVRPLSLRGRPL